MVALLLGVAADRDVGLNLNKMPGPRQRDTGLVAVAGVRLGGDRMLAAATDQHEAAVTGQALHLPALAERVRNGLVHLGNGVRGLGMVNDADLVRPVELHAE